MIQRVLLACGLVVGLAACNKPSEDDCKKAIANIRTLLGTDRMSSDGAASAGWLRSCRGGAKKDSVRCAMEASTVEELRRCGILKGKELDALLDASKPAAPAPSAAPAPTPPSAPPTVPAAPSAAPTNPPAPSAAPTNPPAPSAAPTNPPAPSAAPANSPATAPAPTAPTPPSGTPPS